MRTRVVVAAMSAVLSIGCASGGSSGSPVRPPSGGRDVIVESEITARAADATNAYQIIQKLRPQMLTTRGRNSPNDPTGETAQPKVYIDNVYYGQVGTLQDVVAGQVREIRYINARDATTQWGTGHMGGVILVLTKKR